MRKPLIALTARDRTDEGNRIFLNNESYYTYIQNAGGIPAVVMVTCREDAEEAAARFDGLLITGGEDVDPSYYGEENNGSFPAPHDIDESDFMLFRAFKEAGKPVMGICRGIQVIAAAEGAKLIQDIPSFNGGSHYQSRLEPPIPREKPMHSVRIFSGTPLSEIFGESAEVNSFHHQGLAELPAGYTQTAESTDGIIEGIEKDNVFGVQWHPERMVLDDEHLAIAKQFIQKCITW